MIGTVSDGDVIWQTRIDAVLREVAVAGRVQGA